MNSGSSRTNTSESVTQTAAEWVLRNDRGLTAAEQDEFSQWLAADPRHQATWAEHRWGWDELDRLAGLQSSVVHAVPEPDLLAPKKDRMLQLHLSRSRSLSLLLVVATVTVSILLWQSPQSQSSARVSLVAPRSFALIEHRELADGSTVELNRGAVLAEGFTSGERRVKLERGEAHFKVAKDTDMERPFVVEAAGVVVRAIGTAFNVRLESAAVEVLVTEGTVSVAKSRSQPSTNFDKPTSSGVTLVTRGERAVVSLSPKELVPEVDPVSPSEIEARLAWQPRVLHFTNAPFAEIIAEFNRRNPIRLSLGSPSLGGLRLSATFRSDNVEGFIRLMVSDFGMRAEWRSDDEVTLHEVSAARER